MTDASLQNFEGAFSQVGARLDLALTSAPGLLRGYTAHLSKARGKMLRASVLLACALREDGSVPPDAVCFAASVELLHLATLVHDDVIDDAGIRRGIPTLNKKYGRRAAVICGDYLLCLALRTAGSVLDLERYQRLRLPDYAGRICLGELEQQVNGNNLSLTVLRYLRIISGKTAALFEAACLAGAVLSTEDERERSRYARFGRGIGMVFQLTDDCIDFELDAATAKKPVQTDYEQGVITLPLIRALEQDEELRELARQGTVPRPLINERVRAHGGLEDTRKLSRRYFDRAMGVLNKLSLTAEKRRRLTELAEKAYYGLKV